jgi:polar amino acid transport system substrate-binding protein
VEPGPRAGGAAGVTLISSGKIITCTHLPYPPFQSNDDQGKTIGFDVDMIDLVARSSAWSRQSSTRPSRASSRSGPVHRQVRHRGRRHDDHRRAQEGDLFSIPYFDATQALLVKSDSTVASSGGPQGQEARALRRPTTGLDYAKSKQAENGYEIVEFQDLATETQALTTGQVDAAINDLPVWSEAIKEDKGATKIATAVRHR